MGESIPSSVTNWLRTYGWQAEVFFIVLATAASHVAVRFVLKRLQARFTRTRNIYDDALIVSAGPPLALAIWTLGISWAVQSIAPDGDRAEVFNYVDEARGVAVLWALIWFALKFIRYVETRITDERYTERPVDRTTVIAVGRLLRASIVITGTLMVLQTLGFSVTGLLAFGGIGGAAIGFAAKDLLANFFGALMIFLDRPFSVGDWIRSPDREIEGTVEEIGWRLTRIRTFDQRPLYVPNSVFTTLTVENPSRMLNRRIFETIGVRYADVAAVSDIVADVEAMLRGHEAIDQQRTLMVNFNAFGDSSLDFFIYTFTRTTVWTEYHAIKQEILMKVADIIAAHGAEIAFPTRTLHLAQGDTGEDAQDDAARAAVAAGGKA